jgi:hypothetical protein
MVLRRHWVFVSFLSRVVVEFLLHPVNLADIFFFLLLLAAGCAAGLREAPAAAAGRLSAGRSDASTSCTSSTSAGIDKRFELLYLQKKMIMLHTFLTTHQS